MLPILVFFDVTSSNSILNLHLGFVGATPMRNSFFILAVFFLNAHKI
jgi:hypothetical protein